jgi:predicted glycoside hydrolase/deacetylase ChbG (UPF0249 family)
MNLGFLLRLCFVGCIVFFGGSASLRGETWSARLGYSPSSKVLVMHAQEMGLCHESNSAVARLLENGGIQSAGVMPPCPWFADAASWSAAHPSADVGLELTLNSEWEHYRWRPVAGDSRVATLLDADRFLWRSPMQTMVNAHAADVEQELMAQIAYAKSLGLRPTHLTTHLGTLVTRPDLIEIYLRVARQQWIPAMIVELTPEQVERFRSQGYPLPDDIIALLDDYPLPKVDDLRMIAPAESYAAKKAAFLKLLSELSPGLTQIALHPADDSAALRRIATDWQQRVWDAQLMADDEVRSALRSDGIELTNWREILRRFEGRPGASDAPNSAPAAKR